MEQLDIFGGGEAITTATPARRARKAKPTQFALFAVDAATRDEDKAADERFADVFNLTSGAVL